MLASLDDLKKSAASLPTGLMQSDWQNFFYPKLAASCKLANIKLHRVD